MLQAHITSALDQCQWPDSHIIYVHWEGERWQAPQSQFRSCGAEKENTLSLPGIKSEFDVLT
jgi:hypothetical protein